MESAELTTDLIISEVSDEKYIPLTNFLDRITPDLTVIPNVSITVEMAKDLLSRNKNRPITKGMVDRYARDFADGKRIFAGNMVKFDWNGNLIDGQHQLLAQIKVGITLDYNIQTGLDPEAFKVMDSGRARSAGDIVAIEGYSDFKIIASAIKSVIYFDTIGRLRTNIQFGTVTNTEVEAWTHRKADMKLMVKCVTFVKELKAKKKAQFLAPSTMSFAYFLLAKQNLTEATDFITKLATGENISMENTPAVLLLRDRLINFTESHVRDLRRGGQHTTEVKIKYVFRAWNAFRTNEKISKLIIDRDGKIEKPV